jgi:hypothetical protein
MSEKSYFFSQQLLINENSSMKLTLVGITTLLESEIIEADFLIEVIVVVMTMPINVFARGD